MDRRAVYERPFIRPVLHDDICQCRRIVIINGHGHSHISSRYVDPFIGCSFGNIGKEYTAVYDYLALIRDTLIRQFGRAARCSRNIRQIEARTRRVAPLVCQQTGSDVFGDKSGAHLTRQRQHIPFGFAAVPQRSDLRGRKGVVEETCAEDDSGERPAAVR